jgi:hypothetical protein
MGSELTTRGATATLSVQLSDADYTGTFDVAVWSGAVGGDAVREVQHVTLQGGAWQTITVALPTAGEQFFYLEIKEPSPDRMAWSAPIWIERL